MRRLSSGDQVIVYISYGDEQGLVGPPLKPGEIWVCVSGCICEGECAAGTCVEGRVVLLCLCLPGASVCSFEGTERGRRDTKDLFLLAKRVFGREGNVSLLTGHRVALHEPGSRQRGMFFHVFRCGKSIFSLRVEGMQWGRAHFAISSCIHFPSCVSVSSFAPSCLH